MMKNYYPCDLRKLGQKPLEGCEFYLHKPSLRMEFSTVSNFAKQEDNINLDEFTELFTQSYRAPEVYTAIVNNCTISTRCPDLPRYWGMFFESEGSPYHIINFLSTDARKSFPKHGIFEIENDVARVDLSSKQTIFIEGDSVWFFPFDNLDHFLRECLPGLLTLRQMNFDFNKLNFLISDLSTSIKEFLLHFGVPAQRMISIDSHWLHCERLIIPCFGTFGHLHSPTEYYVDAADSVSSKFSMSYNYKKLYISRRNASWRRVLNEDAFAKELEQRGFMIIEPGDYSKEEQLKLFKNAEIII